MVEDKWDAYHLEAIFELELGSWVLPKYIPLNPVVINERSIEEYKVNLAGTCKIVSRCKNALVRLLKCPCKLINESEINIRNIVNHVNNWFSGLSNFLNDITNTVTFEINEDLKQIIKDTKILVDKWNDKIYPKWISKWEPVNNSKSESDNDTD